MAAKSPRVSAAAKAAFARRLAALMGERGLSGAETARRMREHLPESARISKANLWQYLHGKVMPSPQYLDALCSALGVERSALVPDLKPPPRHGPSRDVGPKARPPGVPGDVPEGQPTVSFEDFGDEVHLWIAQRVSWDVALKIMELLKEQAPGGDSRTPAAFPATDVQPGES